MYLNIIKAIYDKPIANIILNAERQTISLKSGIRQECPVSTLAYIMLELLAREIR
jgi:hypothetical protein